MLKCKMIVVFSLVLLLGSVQAQVDPDLRRYIRVGELQSVFSSWGAERAWNNVYYEGLSWPSQYPYQDNAVIERYWIACQDFTDDDSVNFPYYGIYVNNGYIDRGLFPIKLKQIARSRLPGVYVNGIKRQTDEDDQIDEYDPNLPADRVITNIVNTSMGLTITRKIYAFSHPNHDDYFIKEYSFENTGNTDYDLGIERTETLRGVRIGKLPRYSVCREGASKSDNQQTWGKHSWVSKRGEDYADHSTDIISDDYTIADWIRCGFSWAGQSEQLNYDNIGAPDILENGRLNGPQFAGVAVLHVDKSSTDSGNDPQQPAILGWHGGDTYPNVGDLEPSDSLSMHDLWNFLGGSPYRNSQYGGPDRMDESNMNSITDPVDPYTVHGDGGGTGIWIGYGPFDLAFGNSITIVEVDGVNGLSREKCMEIGEKWLEAYQNPSQNFSFQLPDGSDTDNKDIYKNSWFYTGIDSLLLTFSRAKRNYDSGFSISVAPPPPMTFEILSDTNSIRLKWDDSAESYSDFGGYRIYRRSTDYELIYDPFESIFECGYGTSLPAIVNEYIDLSIDKTLRYQYCITSFNQESNNGGISVESNIHATWYDTWVEISNNSLILQDIYVSPDGNDDNDGLTAETPLKTINCAIERAGASELRPITIYLAEGTYSPSATGEQFPINGKGNISIKGCGQNATIIDAENSEKAIFCKDVVDFKIKALTIKNGYGDKGGGLYLWDSDISVSAVRIIENQALTSGGGIYATGSSIAFDEIDRCNIYWNFSNGPGSDISGSITNVYVDTFTVASSTPYHYAPSYSVFSVAPPKISILNGKEEQVNADLYISPNGNDVNSGLSESEPLRSFRKAIIKIYTDSTTLNTIHLLPGIYTPDNLDNSGLLYCRDYVTLKGESCDNTQIDSCRFILNAINDITIQNIAIEHSSYDAIDVWNSSFRLDSVIISNMINEHSYAISLHNSKLDIFRSSIQYNTGSGISCYGFSDLFLSGTNIKYNQFPGMTINSTSNVSFDPENRCNIFNNGISNDYDISTGRDITSNRLIHVVLDTFTLKYPTKTVASPIKNFTFDILAGKRPQILGDAYVSPNGDDANDGISWDSPLKTINKAIEILYTYDNKPHTIYLGEGVFSNSANGEEFPIVLTDNITLKGLGDSLTILDGEDERRVIECLELESINLKDLSVTRGFNDLGAGIYCDNSTITLENVWIRECKGKYGAGIYVKDNSLVRINFVSVTNDSAKYGSAICCSGSHLVIQNSTFVNNGDNIGGIYIGSDLENESEIFIVNTIFWQNGIYQIAAVHNDPVITIAYSDIYEGQEKIKYSGGILNWLDGNIDSDPLFIGGEPYDYHLNTSSQCRETGTNLVIFEGDTLFYLPDSCYTGNAPNIGRWGVDPALGIGSQEKIPEKFMLYPNYPNPFNPSTTIAYDLPEIGSVNIAIYDVLGREVRTLVKDIQAVGHYSIRWDGRNDQESLVAGGIYFICCIAGKNVQVQKMLLLK